MSFLEEIEDSLKPLFNTRSFKIIFAFQKGCIMRRYVKGYVRKYCLGNKSVGDNLHGLIFDTPKERIRQKIQFCFLRSFLSKS